MLFCYERTDRLTDEIHEHNIHVGLTQTRPNNEVRGAPDKMLISL